MPRPAVAARTTTVLFATASLFPTLAYAGHVSVGAYEVVAERSDAQAPVHEVLLKEDGGDASSCYVSMNALTFDSRGSFEVDALAPQAAILPTAVADGAYPSAMEGAIAVPLPGPVWAGIIGLGTAAWVKRLRRRRT
jgi:hypothetical protein